MGQNHTMIPFAILAGKLRTKAGEKEIRILELSPEYFTFRLLTKQAKQYVQLLTEAGQQSTIELSFFQFKEKRYHELTLDDKTDIQKIEMLPEEETDLFLELRVTVTDKNKEYADCAEQLNREYMNYVYLKLEETDAELSQALTGYPAEKEQIYSENLTKQRVVWDHIDEGAHIAAGGHVDIPTVFLFNEQGKKVSRSFSLGIELDNPAWYQAYLTYPLDDFFTLYWDSSNIPLNHPLRTQKPQFLYIGNAYCPHLFPKEDQLYALLEKTLKEHLCPVLVFAPVEEKDILNIEKIMDQLAVWCIRNKVQIELVLNDWGMAGIVRNKYQDQFQLTLGCLLSKQRRDTRIHYINRNSSNSDNLGKESEAFGQGPLQTPFYQNYLREHFHITRVSLQSCGYQQMLSTFDSGNSSDNGIGVTFHFLFFQMNTSGWCPLLATLQRGDRAKQTAVDSCNCPCMDYAFEYPDFLHMTGRYNSIFGYDNSIINELPHIEGIRFVAGFLNTPIKKDRNKSKNENKSIDRKI